MKRFGLSGAILLAAWVAAAGTPVELVNSAFEQADKNGAAIGWSKHANWHHERAGHNGSGGLVFELAEGAKRRGGRPYQAVKLTPGRRYYFSALVKAENLKTERNTKAQGIGLYLEAWNASNKWVWGASTTSKVSGNSKDWVKVEGLSREVPDGVVRAHIQPFVDGIVSGRGLIDNIYLEEYEMRSVEGVYSDKYRHEADKGEVTFNAVLNLDERKYRLADYAATFTYLNAAGTPTTVPGQIVSRTHARIRLAVADMALGTNAVVCAVTVNGKELGRGEGRFIRVATPTKRKVYIDEYRRTIVDGKPFFPLGMYFRRVTESNLQHYCQAPFNVLMPYGRPDAAGFDLCEKYGLKVIYNLQACIEEKDVGRAWMTKQINLYKDHPALLAWYTNDEKPLTMIPRLTIRQRIVEELDKDHPTWSVQDVYTELAHYLPTYDVLGMDPYPIGRRMPLSRCIYTMRQSDKDAFGSRAVWHVPQAFGWNWLFRKSTAKMICPNRTELENMSWQAIAGGANGLVYYAYHHIVEPRATKNNDDEFTWADMCAIAKNIKRYEAVMLGEPGAKVQGVAADDETFAARTWRHDGANWLLAVNCTTNAIKTSFTLAGVTKPVVRSVDFGPAPQVSSDGALSLALPPMAFSFIKLD